VKRHGLTRGEEAADPDPAVWDAASTVVYWGETLSTANLWKYGRAEAYPCEDEGDCPCYAAGGAGANEEAYHFPGGGGPRCKYELMNW
jgi:hypothetical protein